MPKININGVPPGTPPGQPGTFSGVVGDNLRRESDFEAARSATQRAEAQRAQQANTQYDQALRQKAQQDRMSAAAEARKTRQEEALFRRREQFEARQQREQEKQLRDETRMRQAQMRDEARERQRAERSRQQDERAQIMLERRQAAEIERRTRQEGLLGRAYSNLQSRSSATLSPATYRAIERAKGNLDFRVQSFRNRYGTSPFGVGNLDALLGSMGSFQNTYATQNINRLGNMGGRAADDRNYTELVRIEHELKRIERINEKQVNATQGVTKEQKVNAQRNLDAIREARARIATGTSGNSPIRNRLGRMHGSAMALFNDPTLRTALDIAAATVGAPFAIGKLVSGIVGMQQPYLNFRLNEAQLARAGGFGMNDLQSLILPSGAVNSALPGFGQSAAMRALGLGPNAVLQNLNSYGVAPKSAEEAFNVAASVRSAYVSPGIGLNEDALGKLLGQARQTGAVQGGTAFNLSAQRYFSELQKVTASATAVGVDRSRFANIFSQIMATGIGTPSPSSAGNFIGRMLGSGAPSMRTGQGEVSLMSDINRSMANVGAGGGVVQNIGMASFFRSQGGMPASEEGLRKSLGVSKSDWIAMVGTPTAQAALSGYLSAIHQGDQAGAMQYVGQIIQGHPEIADRIFSKSAFGQAFGNNADLGPRARAAFLGTSLPNSLAMQATLPSQGSAANGVAPAVTPAILSAAYKASQATGVPVTDIMAISAAENRFGDATSSAGAIGPFQIMPGTARMYGFTPEDMHDPSKAAIVAAKEFAKNEAAARAAGAPEDLVPAIAMGAYNWGRGNGHIQSIMSGNMPAETLSDMQRFQNYRTQYGNSGIPELQTQATGDTANIKAAEYVTNSVDVMVSAFSFVTQEANKLATSLAHAADVASKVSGSMPLTPATPWPMPTPPRRP